MDGECQTCGKRRVDPMTARLQELSVALRAGMPIERDELCAGQWLALGVMRMKQGGGLV